MSQYDKGYIDGQKDEAQVCLDNLQALKEELDSVGYDPDRSYINILISDLEKFINEK